MIAHRGAMAEAPQNTVAAFNKALTYPVNGIEFDVQLSKDGVPVICHDSDLNLIGRGDRRLDSLNYNRLRTFDWGGWFSKKFLFERLPTLKQVLARYSAKTCLFIELKVDPEFETDNRYYFRIASRTLDLIKRIDHNALSNIHILSFDRSLLTYTQRLAPHFKYVLNLETPPSPGQLKSTNIFCNDFFGCCLPIENLNADCVNLAHVSGKNVFTYSCDTPEQVDKAFGLTVDGIMTNNPAWFFEYITLL